MTVRYLRLGWGRWRLSVALRVWTVQRAYKPGVSKPVSAALELVGGEQ